MKIVFNIGYAAKRPIMTHNHALPVILVSAVDEASAVTIISEIIDNEPPETTTTDRCRVWRIANKYYTADVVLCPVGDDAPAPAPGAGGDGGAAGPPAQAHLIYLTEQECRLPAAEAAARAERRAARGGVRGEAGVLLALCGAAERELPAALRAWALRRRAELVPLLADGDGAGEGEGEGGVARARAALHAHRWPAPASAPDSASDSEPEWAEWAEGPEAGGSEAAVERFAAALRLATAARAELRALPRAERLDRAEQLLRALGGAARRPPPPPPPPPPRAPADAAVDDVHL